MRPFRVLFGAGITLAGLKAAGDMAVRRYEDVPLTSTRPLGHLAQVEGLRFHYLDEGSGPALVLLHGLGASASSFRRNIPALSQRFRVIAIDLAGHGLSTRTAPDLSLTAQARYLAGLLDHLGVERASLAGHSLGGSIAQRFAIAWPDRVDRLVLIASTTDDYVLRASRAARLMAPFIPVFLTAVVHNRFLRERELRLIVHDASHLTPEIKAEYASPGHIKGHACCYQQLMVDRTKDQRLDLSKLKAPTLILWGDTDRLVSIDNGRKLERDIPDARLVVIPQAGHLVPEEQPEIVNDLLLEFLPAEPAAQSSAKKGTRNAKSPARRIRDRSPAG